MGKWYELKDPDEIEFSHDRKDMHIFVDSDEFGGVYVSVPVALVREKLMALNVEITHGG